MILVASRIKFQMVKDGVEQIQMDLPYNEARKTPSKDMIFCTYCMLFGTVRNVPLVCGTNTWEGLSKKLKEHESRTSH